MKVLDKWGHGLFGAGQTKWHDRRIWPFVVFGIGISTAGAVPIQTIGYLFIDVLHYSAKQAALVLGASVSAVHNLRERGRLAGVHLRAKKVGSAKGPWWFFAKEAVHALQADGEYMRHAERGKRAQRARFSFQL